MIANLLNYIIWDPDPILAHLGPMTIRYYSTCWMIGLLLGYLLMSKLYKQQGLSDEKFSPLFLYIFFGVLIGAVWDIASSISRNISSPSGITSSRC